MCVRSWAWVRTGERVQVEGVPSPDMSTMLARCAQERLCTIVCAQHAMGPLTICADATGWVGVHDLHGSRVPARINMPDVSTGAAMTRA